MMPSKGKAIKDLRISPLLPLGKVRDEGIGKEVPSLHPLTRSLREREPKALLHKSCK